MTEEETQVDERSVWWWRDMFATNGPLTRGEIEAITGKNMWHVRPDGSEFRYVTNGEDNLCFAGELQPVIPVGVAITPEVIDSKDTKWQLVGPNGLSAADMLTDEFARKDDRKRNDAANDPKGYVVVRKVAIPRANMDVAPALSGTERAEALRARFEEAGGIWWIVEKYSDREKADGEAKTYRFADTPVPQYRFRGTGLEPLTPPAPVTTEPQLPDGEEGAVAPTELPANIDAAEGSTLPPAAPTIQTFESKLERAHAILAELKALGVDPFELHKVKEMLGVALLGGLEE